MKPFFSAELGALNAAGGTFELGFIDTSRPGGGGITRVFRTAALSGLGAVGPLQLNPSLEGL